MSAHTGYRLPTILDNKFDGDTGSLNTVYSDEAVQQVNEFFNSKKAYVGTDGKFTSTIDISTVALVMHNITFPD